MIKQLNRMIDLCKQINMQTAVFSFVGLGEMQEYIDNIAVEMHELSNLFEKIREVGLLDESYIVSEVLVRVYGHVLSLESNLYDIQDLLNRVHDKRRKFCAPDIDEERMAEIQAGKKLDIVHELEQVVCVLETINNDMHVEIIPACEIALSKEVIKKLPVLIKDFTSYLDSLKNTPSCSKRQVLSIIFDFQRFIICFQRYVRQVRGSIQISMNRHRLYDEKMAPDLGIRTQRVEKDRSEQCISQNARLIL